MGSDFEKKIREILASPPDFSAKEKNWKKLQKRIAEHEKPSKEPSVFHWSALLLLFFMLLSGVLGFLYWAEHNKNIAFREIQQTQQVLYTDTIIETHKRIIYDTIYKQIVSNIIQPSIQGKETNNTKHYAVNKTNNRPFHNAQNLFQPTAKTRYLLSLEKSFSESYISTILSNNGISAITNELSNNKIGLPSPFKNIVANNKPEISLSENSNHLSQLSLLSKLPALPLHSLLYSHQLESTLNAKLAKQEQRRTLDYYLSKMSPRSFALSTYGGISYSLNIKGEDINPVFGLRTEIGYNRNFSLLIGIEYLQNKFSYYVEDSASPDTQDLPNLAARNPGDLLHEIYGDFRFIQIPFGFKYTFKSKNFLKPYVGVGLVTHKPIRSRLTYEYLSIFEEYYVDADNLLASTFAINDAWSTVGFNLNYKKNWNFYLEGLLQMELSKQPFLYENHQYIRFNTGLQYLF